MSSSRAGPQPVARAPVEPRIQSKLSPGSLDPPACVESVVTTLPTGADSAPELWKLNHYYERLDKWYADHGIPIQPGARPAAEPEWELHNLTADPEERHNATADAPAAFSEMHSVLEAQRDQKRLLPSRNAR